MIIFIYLLTTINQSLSFVYFKQKITQPHLELFTSFCKSTRQMAYTKVLSTRYDAEKDIVERLSKFKGEFNYNADTSLPLLAEAVEELGQARSKKNATLDLADADTIAYNAAADKVEKIKANMRMFVAADKSRNSDEYVILGGVRQSDLTAQQQQTREANKAEAQKKLEEMKSK